MNESVSTNQNECLISFEDVRKAVELQLAKGYTQIQQPPIIIEKVETPEERIHREGHETSRTLETNDGFTISALAHSVFNNIGNPLYYRLHRDCKYSGTQPPRVFTVDDKIVIGISTIDNEVIDKEYFIESMIDFTIGDAINIARPLIEALEKQIRANLEYVLKEINTQPQPQPQVKPKKHTQERKRTFKTKAEFISKLKSIPANVTRGSIKPYIEGYLGITYRSYRNYVNEFNITGEELKEINPGVFS